MHDYALLSWFAPTLKIGENRSQPRLEREGCLGCDEHNRGTTG
jgi:hypothetical protein